MKPLVHRVPGLVLTDHVFRVPLDHARPRGEQIEVFAREAVAAGRETERLPWLVFLQGGPGFPAPRPAEASGWLKRAVQEYRVLLLDQRGTGRSTPVTFQTMARWRTPHAQAAYLKHFRADSIVRDCEWIRRRLLRRGERWSVLGQSYGGFCAVHYLSAAPEGLREAIITGGIPSLTRPADEVYRAAYPRVREKNRLYFERYPQDRARAQKIARYLAKHTVAMPGGGRLTVRRFQQLGLDFGMSDGFEKIHYLLEEAFVRGVRGEEMAYGFLRGVQNAQAYETNPIFAILHEAIYAQRTATRWAAHRVRAEFPEFDVAPDKPFLFTGEMIYPWMFEDYAGLAPLREAAHVLAEDEDWPPLYDLQTLGANEVPVVAAVYYNDMYVDRAQSEESARRIRGIRLWVTSEYEHNGLRADGERVLGRLLAMLRGEC